MGADLIAEPFRIDIPDAALADLERRLSATRWPEQLPGKPWEKGVPVDYLKDLAQYWAEQFDWRHVENRLNGYPQFRTIIDGQCIHFLHVRSENPDAIPLLLLHGWPGSVLEFLDVIDPLVDPQQSESGSPAFHLVIPSLVGFGFSTPLSSTGWTPDRNAAVFAELMASLGYRRYGVQGGDYGAAIGPAIARVAPQNVLGVHVNAPVASFRSTKPVSDEERSTLTEREQRSVELSAYWRAERMGYFFAQATRPQTVAYGLTDSPAGQLAWIVEKFKEWTFAGHERPEDAVPRDRLLANVALYWFTGTAATAANMYWEVKHHPQHLTPCPVPVAVANFAEDMGIRRYAERVHHIVRWTDFDVGGHFAALETPDLLVSDIGAFFAALPYPDVGAK